MFIKVVIVNNSFYKLRLIEIFVKETKMITGSYEQIVQMISRASGLSVDEIERKIEAKRAKLSGLISKEGAAQIIASELGINFEKQKMKIFELLTGMKRINVIGKIISMRKVVEYSKNDRKGKIGSFLLADETSNIRVVLWDTNHISILERGEIKEGDTVEISGADIRNGEMHLSGFADIKKSNLFLNDVKEKPITYPKTISNIQLNENVSARAFIVQIYGPSFFYICPVCGKKCSGISQCAEHGTIVPKKKAVLSLVLDDGTGVMRAVLFDEQIIKIASDTELENSEAFMPKREELLGKEFIIEGSARKNQLYENIELVVSGLHEVDIEKLIEELEA